MILSIDQKQKILHILTLHASWQRGMMIMDSEGNNEIDYDTTVALLEIEKVLLTTKMIKVLK